MQDQIHSSPFFFGFAWISICKFCMIFVSNWMESLFHIKQRKQNQGDFYVHSKEGFEMWRHKKKDKNYQKFLKILVHSLLTWDDGFILTKEESVPLQQNLPLAETEFENDIWNTNPSTCPQKETPETGGEQDVPLWLNAGVDHLTLSVFWHLRKRQVCSPGTGRDGNLCLGAIATQPLKYIANFIVGSL